MMQDMDIKYLHIVNFLEGLVALILLHLVHCFHASMILLYYLLFLLYLLLPTRLHWHKELLFLDAIL